MTTTVEFLFEGQSFQVPADAYLHVEHMAKVLYGLTTVDDRTTHKKLQREWAVRRAITVIQQFQWEIKNNGL